MAKYYFLSNLVLHCAHQGMRPQPHRPREVLKLCQEQDLGIWNHLGVVVNWLLGACKMHLGKLLGAYKLDLGKAPVEAPGSL
jgi:hypothetical protein